MGDVLPFKKPRLADKHRGKALCRSGFHKWEIVAQPFDVKQGKLLTTYRCRRCGNQRTEAR